MGHGGADEHDGRTEQVLATATSRSTMFAATLVVALVGATWLLLVSGVAVALGVGTASGDPGGTFGDIVPAALAQAPAVWLVTAIAVAAYSWRSRWAVLGWAFLVLFLTLGQLGELLRLPQTVIDLSPYVHVPKMPVESFAAGPLCPADRSGGGAAGAGLAALPDARHRLTRCRTPLPISPTRPPCSVRGRLARVIDDRQAGVESRVDGRLLLTQVEPGRIRWEESGRWHQPTGDVDVRRGLWLERVDEDGWWVRFEDGTDFHPWSPGEAVIHPCSPDTYVGLVDGAR